MRAGRFTMPPPLLADLQHADRRENQSLPFHCLSMLPRPVPEMQTGEKEC